MQIAEKNVGENVAKKAKIGNISKPILPRNEGQTRPLLDVLPHTERDCGGGGGDTSNNIVLE